MAFQLAQSLILSEQSRQNWSKRLLRINGTELGYPAGFHLPSRSLLLEEQDGSPRQRLKNAVGNSLCSMRWWRIWWADQMSQLNEEGLDGGGDVSIT